MPLGISGTTTTGQIKDGNHRYRALEAHFMLYLTLFNLYLQRFVDNYPNYRKGYLWITSITFLKNCRLLEKDQPVKPWWNIASLNSISFTYNADLMNNLHTRQSSSKTTWRCFKLHFIRTYRLQCWELHLEILHSMIPYFSFDMLNYAHMPPVNLSQMMQMKGHDSTWDLFESGNFSVNKSCAPFTAIGADRGIEQESRSLNFLGGIKGLTNK